MDNERFVQDCVDAVRHKDTDKKVNEVALKYKVPTETVLLVASDRQVIERWTKQMEERNEPPS